MNKKYGIRLAFIVIIIAALVYVAFNGLIINYEPILDGAQDINLGIDLKGGLYAVMEPEKGKVPTKDNLDTAKGIIDARLDGMGIFDRSVLADYTNNRVIVEIPWPKGETTFNTEKVVKDIGDIARLTFRAVDENQKDENGLYLDVNPVLVDGKNVVDARAEQNPENPSNYQVALKFDSQGTKDFAAATEQLLKKPLGIFLDKTAISWPNVETVITGGNAVITGNFTHEEANALASKIKSGKLPFKLEAAQKESITPILGQNALNVSITAGLFSLLLVILFMIFYYRVPGILAAIALIGHTVLQILFISWAGVMLTLPGIAGIILSIGMGVDANVIIFERIKEELNLGKNLMTAIHEGFKRAFTAIWDGNMTALIVAAVLYVLSSGSIRGFAITLSIGVMLDFITAVIVSRSLLINVAGMNIIKNYFWFGKKRRKGEAA